MSIHRLQLLQIALPVTAAVALALIFHGVGTARRAPVLDAGAVPARRAQVMPAPLTSARSWQPSDARTVPVGPLSISPERSPSAILASEAGNPIAANPVPIHLVRLVIPSLGVSASVVDVAVGADGRLSIPGDPRTLGRWSGGAEPGEPYGSTVVVGHVDNASVNGALFGLGRLGIGDRIEALGADGRSVEYRVAATREVPKADLVTSLEPFRQDVQGRLVLVSCGGAFDPVHRHYADNVVVFAVPVSRS